MGTIRFGDLLSILLMAILLPSYFGEKHIPPNEPKYKLISIYLSIGINVRFAAMMADVGDGLL